MTWRVEAIPAADLDTAWPVVEPMLLPAVALSNGRITARSVRQWIGDGRYVLWIAHEDETIAAAFVTRVARYPRKNMLTIDLCGGSQLNDWLAEADQVFRAYAGKLGLDGVELYGRRGWARALKRLDWRMSAVMVETDL